MVKWLTPSRDMTFCGRGLVGGLRKTIQREEERNDRSRSGLMEVKRNRDRIREDRDIKFDLLI